MALNMYLPIITLNVNGLNVATKRHRVTEWVIRQDLYMRPPRNPTQIERYTQTKSKGIEKDISCKWKGKKIQDTNTYNQQIKTLKPRLSQETKKGTTK